MKRNSSVAVLVPRAAMTRRAAQADPLAALRHRSETAIVRAVLMYLRTRPGVWAERNNVGAVTARDRHGRSRFVRFGRRGMADITGWVRTCVTYGCHRRHCSIREHVVARYLAIEVKREGAQLTPQQAAFLDRVRRDGGVAVVARSVQDVIQALDGAS